MEFFKKKYTYSYAINTNNWSVDKVKNNHHFVNLEVVSYVSFFEVFWL